ncbi:TetR/AcrR family transcriptional regulator [Nesterenkonia sp. CL21]|uniref:TetR/AcrR family transcriptional regulator n=1 Tax=Nesterenkonia sp. CL21 TaxID=3064894 RepID=UPI002878B6C6|nr:TetR/AcrR family transcriptional regulator [Nesterenkonia sp. CL21]MDS2174019.1 TetR/AcrR family transcriptional regulator [Nesterenkonia sp. CL21]
MMSIPDGGLGGASDPPRTRRQQEKDRRRRDLLEAAGRLFGTRGFASVALDDIGSEAGVTGQAIYRHFKGKRDMLGQLLLEVSQELLEGGRALGADAGDPEGRLRRLIAFQVRFALRSPEVIRVQEQELGRLADGDRRRIRRMQREYMDIWVDAVGALHPAAGSEELGLRVHGLFGLINSTAHSLKHVHGRAPSAETLEIGARALEVMAQAAAEVEMPR